MLKEKLRYFLGCPSALKRLGALVLVLGLALPVCAQGQSPTSPRQRPGIDLSGLGGLGAQGQQPQNQQQGQLGRESELGQDRQTGRERESLRDRREQAGERLRERDGEEKPAEQAPGAQPGEGPAVIDQGTRPAEAGAAPGEAGPSVVGGKAGEQQGAAGAPGKGKPAPAAGQRGAAAVSVIGEAPFEPAYEHDIEYPEVPDVGEPMDLDGPMQLGEFLQPISLSTDWNVIVSDKVQQTGLGFFIMKQVKPKQALEILKEYDLFYEFDEAKNILYVKSLREVQEEQFGELVEQEFQVQNAEIPYVESVLATVLSPAGRLITDQRTGRIYVWDTADNIENMQKMVGELDVPLQQRVFTVQHADLADIETVLSSMLTANGKLVSDPRTGQVLIWDAPTALEQMAAAVERLDVPVETRTIPIQNINAEDITENLEAMMSERGLVQVDPRSNAVVVTDLPARVDQMDALVKTLDQKLETKTWVVNYADLEFVADQLETYIPDEMGEIILNEDVHQITVTGLPSRLEEIDKLISTWDIPRRQVHIQAFIVEVGNDIEREFNVNWSYFGSDGQVPIVIHSGDGGGQLAEPTGDGESVSIGQLPYAVPLYGALQLDSAGNITRPILTNLEGENVIDRFGGNHLAVTLDYLDKQNKATILSSPRITVNDGEEAIFENATRVPYVSSTTIFGGFANTNNSINNTNRVDFIDVGTILSVLPRISEKNNIVLEIDAEDSTFVLRNILSNGQTSTIPEKTMRRAQTELRVDSGDTIVLGGLRRDRAAKSVSKTPFLGDLPVVGRLFRNPSRESKNSTLLIFLTTTIVEAGTDPEAKILVNAEQEIADHLRHNKKNLWGRLADSASHGANELGISIGENGNMHSEGQQVTLEDLQEAFKTAPPGVLIVIRRHPRAPDNVITAVTEAALEAGLKIEFDDDLVPLVPNYAGLPQEEAAPVATPAPPTEAAPPTTQ
ncbi:MAG: hypothetical protein HYV26_01390 [Candidatus Hydrogenedentes bacterium]|nr:hypothetical protein [Candidatus Hydrogenedentota bacterium]